VPEVVGTIEDGTLVDSDTLDVLGALEVVETTELLEDTEVVEIGAVLGTVEAAEVIVAAPEVVFHAGRLIVSLKS
jgi:hypothetical protein